MQALAGVVDSPAVEAQVAEHHWTALGTQAQAELAAPEQQSSQHTFTNAQKIRIPSSWPRREASCV
jgi:hypothetical protein